MKRLISIVLVLCLCFQMTGCGIGTSEEKEDTGKTSQSKEISQDEAFKKAKKIVKNMSLDQKIGQLFMLDLDKLTGDDKPVTELTEEVKELISRYQLGGVVLESDNIQSVEQVKELNRQLAQCLEIPLYIGTTEEGGGEKSIAEKNDDIKSTGYTTPKEMGKNMTVSQLKDTGEVIATELSELGFNLNFAPNTDVAEQEKGADEEDAVLAVGNMLSDEAPKLEQFLVKKKNKNGKVSKKKTRKAVEKYEKALQSHYDKVDYIVKQYVEEDYSESCFGEDEKVVSSAVRAMVKGMHAKDVATVLNTFPGIASVAKYHKMVPSQIDTGVSRLRRVNFAPYATGIEAGADCVMVGHVALSKIDGDTPSSLSRVIVSDLLRDELGFEGVVITEALDVPVITNEYTTEQAVIRAVVSGVDVIYNPENIEDGILALKRAVMFNEISEKAINQAVLRVLQSKIMRGIIDK